MSSSGDKKTEALGTQVLYTMIAASLGLEPGTDFTPDSVGTGIEVLPIK